MHKAVACALACVVPCGEGRAAAVDPPAEFLFDGRAVAGSSLAWSFSRGSNSCDGSGEGIGADAPRFGGPTLLCGAPVVTTMPGTAGYGNVSLFGAGVLHDNATPALVVYNATIAQLSIAVGFPVTQTYTYSTAVNALKGNQPDFLHSSIDDSPDEAWAPRAAVVCHGEAVLMCAVAVRDAQDRFLPNRIGFATCRLADLSGPKPFWWRRLGYTDALTSCSTNLNFGNTWSMPTWYEPGRSGGPPTRFWCCATDYRRDPCKDGGVYMVFPVSRSGPTSSDWTADAPMELPGRFWFTTGGTHAHAVGVTRYGPAGLLALGARGDSLYNNVDYTWTLDDESNYRNGASVVAGAFNYYAGGVNWSPAREVNGSITTPQAPVSTRALGNQWVGIAPGPAPGTFLVGADEVNQPLWITSDLSGDPAHADFTPLIGAGRPNWVYASGVSNTIANRFHCFHIAAQRPESPASDYAAQIGPGAYGTAVPPKARIEYSADGLAWGQCWAQNENEQAHVGMTGGRIYCGSIGSGTGLGVRSIPVPATRLLRPLRIAPGAFNYATPQLSVRGASMFTTITPIGPAGPALGSLGIRARIVAGDPGASTPPTSIGAITLADHVPTGTGVARLRLWVRPDFIGDGGAKGSSAFQVRLRSTDESIGETSRKTSGLSPAWTLPGSGAWTPVTLNTELSSWGSQPGLSRIDAEFLPSGGLWVPQSFEVVIDSFVIGDAPPPPSNPQVVSNDETAAISGFSLAGDWTVVLAGMTPPDSWDVFFPNGLSFPVSLLSLCESGGQRSVEISADAASSTISAQYWNGQEFDPGVATIAVPNLVAESPVLLGVAYDLAQKALTLTCSVGGSAVASASLANIEFAAPIESIRFGSSRPGVAPGAMNWFGGSVQTQWRSIQSVTDSLVSLDFLRATPCPSDFDHNDFVNGEDFDAFLDAFALGLPGADYDGNGFVNGEDFDGFAAAFMDGC